MQRNGAHSVVIESGMSEATMNPDINPEPSEKTTTASRARRLRRVAVGVAVLLIVDAAAAALGILGLQNHDTLAAPISVGQLPAVGAAAKPAAREPGPPPLSIDIPRISVSSGLDDLRLGTDGAIAAPAQASRAGWWSQGVTPGDPGPAVVIGHVDSYHGPGVFLRLRDLLPGDEIVIHRNDGSSARFAVDAARQFSKDSFPSDVVYGPTGQPELRLITCGGRFDRRARHYLDNLVVFAHLIDIGQTA